MLVLIAQVSQKIALYEHQWEGFLFLPSYEPGAVGSHLFQLLEAKVSVSTRGLGSYVQTMRLLFVGLRSCPVFVSSK